MGVFILISNTPEACFFIEIQNKTSKNTLHFTTIYKISVFPHALVVKVKNLPCMLVRASCWPAGFG